MKETNRPIDELIADYLARELSPDGLTELHAWISSSEENKAYFLRQQEMAHPILSVVEGQTAAPKKDVYSVGNRLDYS